MEKKERKKEEKKKNEGKQRVKAIYSLPSLHTCPHSLFFPFLPAQNHVFFILTFYNPNL